MATVPVVLALAAALTLGSSSPAQSPGAPDSTTQPLADGCQRNPAGLLTYSSPEWVFVNRDAAPHLVEGTARSTHTASGDLPQGHSSYDLNSNVDVNPGYQDLLATGNYAGGGEETGRLHVEWETGTVPTWVWPTEGDQVKLWGSWIWDCGHWGSSSTYTDPDYFLPGQREGEAPATGERTEFHPMRAMVVTRKNPYEPTSTQTETDVFISSAGTMAYAQADCARRFPATNGAGYPPGYTACVQNPANQRQPVNDMNYSFFVPAPPKPSPTATLTYHVVNRTNGNGPPEQITPQADGLQVTVPFQGYGSNTGPLSYGKSFYVGWNTDPTPPTHLEVQFKTLTVVHSLDPNPNQPGQTGTPPGEYGLYLDLNGYWKYINDWAPGLGAVLDGQTFTLGNKVDIYVPAGQGVRLFVSGRECDIPKVNPCPNTTEGAPDNDLPGDATATFPTAAASLGSHTLTASSSNYSLTYTVRQR